MSGRGVIARAKPEVRTGKDPNRYSGKEENSCEDAIRFQGEDEVGEECSAPDDQEQSNPGSVFRVQCAGRRIACLGVCSLKSKRGSVYEAKGQPEDGKHAHDHHLACISDGNEERTRSDRSLTEKKLPMIHSQMNEIVKSNGATK